MSSENASASYSGVAARENSRLHAGHVYGNVVNNFANENGDILGSRPPSSQLRVLAPADSPIHQQFCQAAREGQYRRLEILYSLNGANIDTRDNMEMTPLHHAALRGDYEIMKFLLDYGADVNSRHTLLGSPICAAALRGHSKAVELLFRYKAGLRLTHNGAVGSALHCACFNGNISIVKMILEHGGSLKQSSTISMLAFYDMAEEHFTPTWSPFWSRRYGARQVRCTPVLLAAEQCHFDLLDLCWLEFGKTRSQSVPSSSTYSPDNPRWEFVVDHDTNVRYSHSIGTVVSTEASSSSTWSFLGFQRPAPTHTKSTLLMWAAASLNLDLILYLLKNGARFDTQDAFQRTSLHYAASPFENAGSRSLYECVNSLAQGEISESTACKLLLLIINPDHPTLDPRVTQSYGNKLHIKYIDAILLYSQSKLRVEIFCKALHLALDASLKNETYPICILETIAKESHYGNLDESLAHVLHHQDVPETIVSSLLESGADPSVQSKWTKDTALDVAVRAQAPKAVIALLMEHGANPDLINGRGETPRACAEALNLNYMVELFDMSQGKSRVRSGTPEASSRPWFPLQLRLPSLPFGTKRQPP